MLLSVILPWLPVRTDTCSLFQQTTNLITGDGHSYTTIYATESHKHVPDTTQEIFRQIFWARYVDWSITTPLLLLDLAFLAGLNGADIYVAIVADIVMVLTGLFGAFGNSEGQKWG